MLILSFVVLIAISANTIPEANVVEGEDAISKAIELTYNNPKNKICVGLGKYCNPRKLIMCCYPLKCGRFLDVLLKRHDRMRRQMWLDGWFIVAISI